ncbi:MAG: formate dehydrogenase accessory sulfurtransferase FdhD, partial [Acidobacteriota bacterium]
MRTPGDDFELATGFLVSEGVVRASNDVWRVGYCEETTDAAAHNVVEVHLHPRISVDLNLLSRHLITSSSCGICGKTSIEAVDALHPPSPRGDFQVDADIL